MKHTKNITATLTLVLLSGCGVSEGLGKNCGGALKELCFNTFGGRTSVSQQSQIDQNTGEIDEIKKHVLSLESTVVSSQVAMNTLGLQLNAQGNSLQNQIMAINGQIGLLQANDINAVSDITSLQSSLAGVNSSISILTASLASNGAADATLASNLSTLQTSSASLTGYVNYLVGQGTNAYNNLNAAILALQSQAAGLQTSLTGLSSNVVTLQSSSNTATVQLATIMGYKNIVEIKDPCGAQGNIWNEVFLKLADGTFVASFSDNASGLNTRFAVLKDGSYMTTDGTNCNFTVSGNGTVISNEHN